jgi:OFA family oxalate/formate antiporter-like MFS transporter
MGSISAIHGITLSAWGFAGLAGNQMAAWIVKTFGEEVVVDGNTVNPTGYQYVLYATLALYVLSLLVSFFLVKPSEAGEAVHDH